MGSFLAFFGANVLTLSNHAEKIKIHGFPWIFNTRSSWGYFSVISGLIFAISLYGSKRYYNVEPFYSGSAWLFENLYFHICIKKCTATSMYHVEYLFKESILLYSLLKHGNTRVQVFFHWQKRLFYVNMLGRIFWVKNIS